MICQCGIIVMLVVGFCLQLLSLEGWKKCIVATDVAQGKLKDRLFEAQGEVDSKIQMELVSNYLESEQKSNRDFLEAAEAIRHGLVSLDLGIGSAAVLSITILLLAMRSERSDHLRKF